jgi:hypothetical protein
VKHCLPFAAALVACTPAEPPPPAAAAPAASEPAKTVPPPTKAEERPTVTPPTPVAKAETPAIAEPTTPSDDEPTPPVLDPPPPEIAIQAWSSTPHTATWTMRFEPSEPVALVDVQAGVLGRAGTRWVTVGADGQLADVAMSVEPKLPIDGVWPTDAWFVDRRSRMEGDDEMEFEYHEIRLMKLRDGKRWVPQLVPGRSEQWFHPGTDDWDETRISTLSGMIVYNVTSFRDVTRVAGRYPDPFLGPHRGDVVDFVETGKAEVYVISSDADGYYAQTQCEDEECVKLNARKLPLSSWTFGEQVARGKHAVSLVAKSGDRRFVLHYRGKPGWVLDELPAGDGPTGFWASEEGGLWTLTGETLRWRDTESVWHDVALPEDLGTPTVALSGDRKQVFVSGVVAGAAKIFTTDANAVAPAKPATP